MDLVGTASGPTATTDPSISQYNDIFGHALNAFEKLIRQYYKGRDKPTDFESAEAALIVLDETVRRFGNFRADNQKLLTWLESYVDLLFTVSATLWETTQTVSLTHDPFCINVL